MISLIVAMDKERAIGINNDLPWRLPADLAYFKKTTLGHPIMMGRKTYESIGKALPGRENIVITSNKDYKLADAIVVHSLEEAVQHVGNADAFIIGGAQIYQQSLTFASRLYITHIHETFPADAFFPEIDEEVWKKVSTTPGVRDEKNPHDYEFAVYERR